MLSKKKNNNFIFSLGSTVHHNCFLLYQILARYSNMVLQVKIITIQVLTFYNYIWQTNCLI